MPNFVKIGQSIAKVSQFSIFQDGGCVPPSILLGKFGPPTKCTFWSLLWAYSAKFGCDLSSSLNSMKFSIFGMFSMKTLLNMHSQISFLVI